MKNRNVALMRPNPGAVFISASNLATGIVYKSNPLLCSQNFWHKFIVSDSAMSSRNEILDAVLDQVHPMDLIPVSFWRDSNGANFLARNCGAAIHKLCNDNLVVVNPKSTKTFKLKIILKFATTGEFKIDVQKNIHFVLTKRFNTTTKVLNLIKFHEDPELSEYCPLSQPRIMFFVLHIAKSLIPPPEVYLMNDNGIKLLNPMELLVTQAPYIRSIDLRNNLISDINTLNNLKIFQLTELYLDGNPFCEKMTREEYVLLISNTVKGLTTLDGVSLKSDSLHVAERNYVCNFEAAPLVNQFLEHYFHIYDSNNRTILKELYHKNAMFSLNSTYHPNQLTSANTRIHTYSQISRNLHKISNFSMLQNNLYLGNQQIVNILSGLPVTEHDPYSFTIDVVSYTSRSIIVGVSGVFREVVTGRPEDSRLYGFLRTFVLEIVNGDGLSYIVNEQAHIYNAFSWQVVNTFKIQMPITDTTNIPQNPKEQQKVIQALRKITNMNAKWSKKCLEECNYDLKKTLIMFVELFKQNRIPENVFVYKTKKMKCKYNSS